MINWIKGKLGFKHNHYVNIKELFKYRDFGTKLKCTICKKELGNTVFQNYPPKYRPKEVRMLARGHGLNIKWYEYVFNSLLRKRLLKYFKGN